MGANKTSFGLQDIGRALARHKFVAAAGFALVLVIAVFAAVVIPKSYHSEGLLLIRIGKENATLDPTVTMSQDTIVAMPLSRDNELNSVVEILKSRAIAEKVVDALTPEFILDSSASASDSDEAAGQIQQWLHSARKGIAQSVAWLRHAPSGTPAERDDAIEELMAKCNISAVKRTNLIQIECKGPSPEWTQKIVAEMMNAYQAEHLRLNRPGHSVEFFAEQTDRTLRELTNKQEVLCDLKTSAGVVSPVEQRQAFALRVSRMEEDLQQAQAGGAVSEMRIRTLHDQLNDLPAEKVESVVTGIGNAGTEQMRSQLYQLEIRKEEAAAKYTDNHPAMRAMNEEVQASKKVANSEEPTRTHVTKSQSRVYQDVEIALLQEQTQLAADRAKQNALNEQLVSLRGQIKGMNQQELAIAALNRDIDVYQNAYHRFAAGYEQAKIDHARELENISNIAVAQPATCEPEAVFPKKASFLAIGALAGLLAGIAAALLAEGRYRLFREPEDVERRLGVAVLATIPHLAGRQLSSSDQRRV